MPERADFEHFIDERIFLRRGDPADELFLHQRLFLQRVLVEQLQLRQRRRRSRSEWGERPS